MHAYMCGMKLSGTKLREARKAAGLRIEDVAVATGISYATVLRAEQGTNTPSASYLALICRELGVPMESLFEEETALNGGQA